MRKEVDCTIATITWIEEIQKDEKYKTLDDSDLDNEKDDTTRVGKYSGPNSSANYDEEVYHNIKNMMECWTVVPHQDKELFLW